MSEFPTECVGKTYNIDIVHVLRHSCAFEPPSRALPCAIGGRTEYSQSDRLDGPFYDGTRRWEDRQITEWSPDEAIAVLTASGSFPGGFCADLASKLHEMNRPSCVPGSSSV